MPIIKSAIKRVRQTNRRQKRNLIVKNRYKELTKEYIKLLEQGKKTEAAKLYPTVQKSIDMAAKKNLIPKNTAGRRKSALAKMMDKDMVKKDPRAEKKAAKAAPKKEAKPAAKAKKASTTDDLTKIEGVGPKIQEALQGAGVNTYADLAGTKPEKISEIIADVRGTHAPDTWPAQAEMARDGKWDELKKWQDELDGGKA